MDLLEAGCQGLGLALAVGTILGAFGRTDQPALIGLLVAALTGAVVFGLSLTPEDHPAWPGWLIGAPAAVLAYATASDVAHSSGRRAGEGGAGGVAFYIGAYAVVLAGLALLGPVALISIPALLATLWLFVGRRRTAGEKYEGLRSLR
jgi:hypothetical protein